MFNYGSVLCLLILACMKDMRYDSGWFPMTDDEESRSPAAEVVSRRNVEDGCDPVDCTVGKCAPPLICVPLWMDYTCS